MNHDQQELSLRTPDEKLQATISQERGLADVKVEVKEGVAYLHGRVDSPFTKLRAESMALELGNVRDVQNHLEVSKELEGAVEKSLSGEASLVLKNVALFLLLILAGCGDNSPFDEDYWNENQRDTAGNSGEEEENRSFSASLQPLTALTFTSGEALLNINGSDASLQVQMAGVSSNISQGQVLLSTQACNTIIANAPTVASGLNRDFTYSESGDQSLYTSATNGAIEGQSLVVYGLGTASATTTSTGLFPLACGTLIRVEDDDTDDDTNGTTGATTAGTTGITTTGGTIGTTTGVTTTNTGGVVGGFTTGGIDGTTTTGTVGGATTGGVTTTGGATTGTTLGGGTTGFTTGLTTGFPTGTTTTGTTTAGTTGGTFGGTLGGGTTTGTTGL